MDYLTKDKYDEFVKELDHLKRVRRREIAESLEYAKSLGDLSENAEYHEARDTQAVIEDRISHLESILKTAKLISSHDTSAVTVGSIVTIKKEDTKEEKVYTIVGGEESDIRQQKISVKSPLGESILGKKVGESFSFKTPVGSTTYKVISIK